MANEVRYTMATVVRREVLNALADAEAQGQKRLRVIIGLRGPASVEPVKRALEGMGVRSVVREAEDFLAANLTREEIAQIGRLKKHVKAVWLDRPVSAV
jgi:hypothetical protein